ncbi:hypothetical protein B0H14DRAFT_3139410 [Mycena olivaceomarginata]|nr:hypothetical protein B0H14DRAFT_3139410 [Mycena olivaceomarginata]
MVFCPCCRTNVSSTTKIRHLIGGGSQFVKIRQQTTSLTSGLLEKLKRREKRKAGEQGSSRAPKSAQLRSEMSTAAQQLSPEPEVGEDPDQGLDFDAGEPAPVSVIETSGGRRLVH